jgi:hypothetical protein
MVNSGIAMVYAPFPVVPLRVVKWLISQHRMGLYNKARRPHVNLTSGGFSGKKEKLQAKTADFSRSCNQIYG